MKISDLGYLPETSLPEGSSLFRIQWARPRASGVARGPLKLPAAGTGHGRFELADHPVAYLAESPETAAYETLARRETVSLSISTLPQRRLLTVHTTRSIRLADLRPFATAFPCLMSLRYSETRELAEDIRAQGHQGVIYASAQHAAMDCFALFDPPATLFKQSGTAMPLMDSSGKLHVCIAAALRGSRVPLTA